MDKLPEAFTWISYLWNYVSVPEDEMLVSPHIGEDESADIRQSRHLGNMVVPVVSPDKSDEHFHYVHVGAFFGFTCHWKKEMHFCPALDCFAQQVLVQTRQFFERLNCCRVPGSKPRTCGFSPEQGFGWWRFKPSLVLQFLH